MVDSVNVGAEDTTIDIDLSWKEATVNNIMTIRTVEPTNFAAIKSVTLDIII